MFSTAGSSNIQATDITAVLKNFAQMVMQDQSYTPERLQTLLKADETYKVADSALLTQVSAIANSAINDESSEDQLNKAHIMLMHIQRVYPRSITEICTYQINMRLLQKNLDAIKRASAATYKSAAHIVTVFNNLNDLLCMATYQLSYQELQKLLAADAQYKAADATMQKKLHAIASRIRTDGMWDQYKKALAIYKHLHAVYAYNPPFFALEILILEAMLEIFEEEKYQQASSATRRLLAQFPNDLAGNMENLGYKGKWLPREHGLLFTLVNIPMKIDLTEAEQAGYLAAAQIFLSNGEFSSNGPGYTFYMLDNLANKYQHAAAARQSVEIAFGDFKFLAFDTKSLDKCLPRLLERDASYKIAATLEQQQGLHFSARAAAANPPNGGGQNALGKALVVCLHLRNVYGYCPEGFDAEIAALERKVSDKARKDAAEECRIRSGTFPGRITQFEADRDEQRRQAELAARVAAPDIAPPSTSSPQPGLTV